MSGPEPFPGGLAVQNLLGLFCHACMQEQVEEVRKRVEERRGSKVHNLLKSGPGALYKGYNLQLYILHFNL